MKNMSVKRFISAVLCLCMLLSLYVPMPAGAANKDYHSMSISQILNLGEDLTWVFTGDSITHNGSWTAGYNGWLH